MSLKNLDDLFMDLLKDTLDAERQITKALPKMAKAVESEELRTAFEEHLSVTQGQIERLETIFKNMDKAARGKHCPGMEGLLKEGSELIEKGRTGSGTRCSPNRRSAEGRALRDRRLWHFGNLCQDARNGRRPRLACRKRLVKKKKPTKV